MTPENATALKAAIERFLIAIETIADAAKRYVELEESKKPLRWESTFVAPAASPAASDVETISPIAPTPHQISYDAICKAIMGYSDRHGHEAGKALLRSFYTDPENKVKVQYIKQLKVEDYPAVLAKCETAP